MTSRCPTCGARIAVMVVSGPTTATVAPCHHAVMPQLVAVGRERRRVAGTP